MPQENIKTGNIGSVSNGNGASTPMMPENSSLSALKMSNVPTLQPLNVDSQTGINASITGKKIVQTWSIDENRNFWANISTIGWKKIDDGSDASITAFGLLCSSARMTNSNVDLITDDTTGKVTQIYVW